VGGLCSWTSRSVYAARYEGQKFRRATADADAGVKVYRVSPVLLVSSAPSRNAEEREPHGVSVT
jgi:hypothetical protein